MKKVISVEEAGLMLLQISVILLMPLITSLNHFKALSILALNAVVRVVAIALIHSKRPFQSFNVSSCCCCFCDARRQQSSLHPLQVRKRDVKMHFLHFFMCVSSLQQQSSFFYIAQHMGSSHLRLAPDPAWSLTKNSKWCPEGPRFDPCSFLKSNGPRFDPYTFLKI